MARKRNRVTRIRANRSAGWKKQFGMPVSKARLLAKIKGGMCLRCLRNKASRGRGREQKQEALEIVIPCRTGKPDRIFPEYLVKTNALGGPEKCRYRCMQCKRIFHTRRAWAKHSGMVPNIMGTCKVG